MQTYTVTLRYVVETTYTVEATDQDHAETLAWQEVQNDPDHAVSYGAWDVVSIEEIETAN